jgi:NAD(P)-dependent dehydrogenase (short-subunit alcohol dehydrogenase family)
MSNSNDARGTLVVFGGASGIGLATATLGSEAHEHVVIADVDPRASELDVLRSGNVVWRRCDATDPESVEALLAEVMDRHGRIAAVVTTVGGAHTHDPLELDLARWRREIAFNLDSAYVVATAAARLMVSQRGGSIVATSSTYAHVPREDRIGYSAAKAGVIALTKSLALAVARSGVRVNCVAPHTTDTPRLRAMTGDEAAFAAKLQASPTGRIALPEDIAHTILFLASPAAQSITGQVVWVNNGSFMP